MSLNFSKHNNQSHFESLFGKASFERLQHSKILIVGVGAVGSIAIEYLVACGVGTIAVADYGIVAISDLTKQVLYNKSSIGQYKVDECVRFFNNQINTKVIPIKEKLDDKNLDILIPEYDFIIDCTDNYQTKLAINDACIKHGKPFSSSGIGKYIGQVTTCIPQKSNCLRFIFGEVDRSAKYPAFAPVCGVIGSIIASEAVKIIIGNGKPLLNKVYQIDCLEMKTSIIDIPYTTKCICDKYNCDIESVL